MKRLHPNRSKQNRGFTIAELLIVVIVIAILATISVIAYNGVQQRAREARIATQLSQARKEMESHKILNGEWPFQADMDERISDGNPVADSWCHSAHTYLRETGVSEGAISDAEGQIDSNCISSSSNGACLGVRISHAGWNAWDASKYVFITSEKVGVSPAVETAQEGQRWCFG